MSKAYIVAAVRTAGGRRDGKLKDWHPADLAGHVINELLDRSGADPELVEDVIMGCVGQAGEQAANIGRNAVLSSRLPESVPATSVDRQCGSSQQSIHFAAQAVMSGTMDCVIAAGVESMSRVPMGLPISLPFKEGHGFYVSEEMKQKYPNVQFSQFAGAEMVAKKYELSKDDIDSYAYRSHERAIAATQAGAFEEEILAVEVTNEDGEKEMHKVDEGIRFDASLNRDMPWSFEAPARPVQIAIGEQGIAFYEAYNPTEVIITGTATYNVSPSKAGIYFSKIDCFCFTEQVLAPGQRVDMPVSFFVDPEILTDPEMDDVKTITLSYTFFKASETARAKPASPRG